MLKLLEKNFATAFLLMFVLGLALPQASAFLSQFLKVYLMIILFLGFLGIRFKDLLMQFKKPLLILYLVTVFMILMPIAGFFAFKYFDQTIAVGILLVLAIPPAFSSPVMTKLLNGNFSLGMTISITANLIAPFTLVGLFYLLTSTTLSLDLYEIFKSLIIIVFVPLIVAEILKPILKSNLDKVKKHSSAMTVIMVCFIIYSVVGNQRQELLSDPTQVLYYLAFMYLVYFIVYLVTYYLPFIKTKEDRIASASAKIFSNTGLGVVLAYEFFGPEVILIMVLTEVLWVTMPTIFKLTLKHLK